MSIFLILVQRGWRWHLGSETPGSTERSAARVSTWAAKLRGGWTPRAGGRQGGRVLRWQKSRGGTQLPYPVCPTFTVDVSEQRGDVCTQVVYIWVHVIIPTEYFWGVGLLVSFWGIWLKAFHCSRYPLIADAPYPLFLQKCPSQDTGCKTQNFSSIEYRLSFSQ